MKKTITTTLMALLLCVLMVFGLTACGDKPCEHTYDNACDTICNLCSEERTIKHTPEEDDGDCTTEIVCSVCESVTTSAKEHDFTGKWQQAEDGHYHICDNDGCEKNDEIVEHSGEGICEVCRFVYGTTLHPEGASSLSIPNVFEQANHADASIVNEYNKYLFGETVIEDGGEKVVYKSVPALITLKISNRSNKEVTLNSVKLRLVDDNGTVYPIASREVSVQKNGNGIELVYSGTYDEISVTIGKDMEDGEMFDAYVLALPLPDDNAFEGKKIEFIVETSEYEFLVYVLDTKHLAAVNSNNAYNWFAGRQYTVRIGTACREDCSYDENGVCTVCGAVCAHAVNTDDGDCTTAITCSDCGTVTTEAKQAHTPNADDGNCTTAITCSDCGTITTEAKESHTPNDDDGNCLTSITCSDCGTVTTPAKDNHTYTYTDNGDGTHTLNGVCSFCDNVTESATEEHTFLDGACTVCGIIGGYCGAEGENATWTFKDGVFTLYGTGEVYTYGIAAKYPWYDYSRQIESVVVMDGITNIPEDAFYYSTVKTVTIPGSVTTIEDYAFDSCHSLETITLSEGLQSIGYGAFSKCSTLESITIPASVTYIDSFAFSPAGIKAFRVAEENAVYSAIDGNLYSTDECGLTLVKYAIASENTAFVTPAGVTVIGDFAFEGTYNLKSVTISADVRRIGNLVFQGCYELTEVTILSEDIMFDDIYTFMSGYNLHTINFVGTQEQWDEMGLELHEGVTVNCNYSAADDPVSEADNTGDVTPTVDSGTLVPVPGTGGSSGVTVVPPSNPSGGNNIAAPIDPETDELVPVDDDDDNGSTIGVFNPL